jgi:hypothetical protein
MAIKVQIEKGKGYSGKTGLPSWVAELIGLTPSGAFEREFSEATEIDWSDYKPQRQKGTWIETHEIAEGVWEVNEHNEKEYRVVYEREGKLRSLSVDPEDIVACFKHMRERRIGIDQLPYAYAAVVTGIKAEGKTLKECPVTVDSLINEINTWKES